MPTLSIHRDITKIMDDLGFSRSIHNAPLSIARWNQCDLFVFAFLVGEPEEIELLIYAGRNLLLKETPTDAASIGDFTLKLRNIVDMHCPVAA